MESSFTELVPFCEKVTERHGAGAVVVLYGSRARGEAGPFSDWDLLVLADFSDPSRERPLRSSLKGLDVDLQCLTPDEYAARLEAWVSGKKKAPATNGLIPSRAELGMAMSAIEGVCLVGEAHFQRFRELRDEWVREGKIADPALSRLVSINDGLTDLQRTLLGQLKTRNVKSAKVVFDAAKGGCAGESQLYSTLVKMVQPFVVRYPLIKGQGNFGSISGLPAAAMRYTECKASRFLQFGHELSDRIPASKLRKAAKALTKLADKAEKKEVTPKDIREAIAKSTGGKKKNRFLPPVFPHLLANGTLGLPGVDSKIPPFELSKVVAALQLAIDDPDASEAELLHTIGLPDFPTGGVLTNGDEVRTALSFGEGTIKLKSKLEIGKTVGAGEQAMVISNVPFGIHGDDLEEELVAAANEGGLPGVRKVANASSLEHGFRMELSLTEDARIQDVETAVLALPSATTEIPLDIVVVRDGAAERMTLPDLIQYDATRRIERHGNAKRAKKELSAVADLDAEPRRTSL